MSTLVETAKVTLITIVAGAELLDGLEARLKALKSSGYTVIRADGEGVHGLRRRGLLGFGNVRIEALLRNEDAQKLLGEMVRDYEGRGLTAFAQSVEAIPREHFL
jgi:hypothetical protein